MAVFSKKPKAEENPNKELLEGLTALGESFKEGFEKLGQGMTALSQQVAQQTKAVTTPTKKDDDPAAPHDDINVDDLTTAQLLDKMTFAFDTFTKQVKDEFEKRDGAASESSLKTQFDELNKDKLFNELKPEMAILAKEKPHLASDLNSLFAVAKEDNTEKVTEFNKAQAEAKKAEESENGNEDEKPEFGGFTPTSGKSPVGEDGERLSMKEAGDRAWEDFASVVPASAIGGNA